MNLELEFLNAVNAYFLKKNVKLITTLTITSIIYIPKDSEQQEFSFVLGTYFHTNRYSCKILKSKI